MLSSLAVDSAVGPVRFGAGRSAHRRRDVRSARYSPARAISCSNLGSDRRESAYAQTVNQWSLVGTPRNEGHDPQRSATPALDLHG